MGMAIAVLFVLIAGTATAVEAPTKRPPQPKRLFTRFTAFLTMAVGALGAGLVVLLVRPQVQPGWVTTTPWYAFIGGLYAAAIVAVGAYSTPKLGAGPTMVLTVTSQVVTGVLLDNIGALGLEKHPVSWLRIVGCLVAMGGAVLVSLG